MEGRRRFWLAALMAASVVVPAACSGVGTSAGLGSQAIRTADPAATFAPLVYVHPGERWTPIAAADFAHSSVLRWRDDDCGAKAIAAGRDIRWRGAGQTDRLPILRLGRLGGDPPYLHTAARLPGCRRVKVFSTVDYTRPNDKLRPNDIPLEEGFFLDLDDAKRTTGQPPRTEASGRLEVPVYFERRKARAHGHPALKIDYWLLFRLDRRPGPAAFTRAVASEGDWERLSVLLRQVGDEYLPVSVRYDPDADREVPWQSVPVADGAEGASTHPVAYAARGSHTLYPTPRRIPIQVVVGQRQLTVHDVATACPRCIPWRTWRNLKPARRQPWYGYGGAWGDSLGPRTAMGGLGPSKWTEIEPFELD